MSDWTVEELIIARIARSFDGDERVAIGASILSDIASRLAKATHAPDLILVGGTSFTAWDVPVLPKALDDERAAAGSALSTMDWIQNFDGVAQDKVHIWISPVQVDQSGNSNISVIGDWQKPKIQLVGARGVPDDLWGLRRLDFHIRKHTARTFVGAVDFVCGVGYGERRRKLNLTAGKPGTAISDLGVFGWDDSGKAFVESLHPGVSIETVQERTAWAWSHDGDVPETAAPTDEELRLIREVIDPRGLRRLESDEASDELWDTLIEEERKMLAVREGYGPS